MSEGLKSWWRGNGGMILVLAAQAILGVVWGARLDGRVTTIEQRGSPQIENVEKRLTIVETKQNVVIENLNINGRKLDDISNELRKHEFDTKK